jgi:DNA-binding transcriptional ArsR family regulator
MQYDSAIMANEPASQVEYPASPDPRARREATVREARALGHPLRLQILRLSAERELTNKQLADHLGRDPGTVLYHVRRLVAAGLLELTSVRAGESGALEKLYRSTGRSWWLYSPDREDVTSIAAIQALQEELGRTGPDSVATFSRFILHLSPEDVAELDRRLLAILDEYVETDSQRLDRPALGGLFVLHRLAGSPPVD